MIYSSIAESSKSGTLKQNDFLRKTFVGFIQESMQYLTEVYFK